MGGIRRGGSDELGARGDNDAMGRRSYGTGQLFVKRDTGGREHWYGRFYVGDSRPKRRIGLKRASGSSSGLTRAQAEKKLRQLMEAESLSVAADNRLGIEVAGVRYIDHLATVMGRKPSTIADYRYLLRGHFVPFFGERKLDRLDADLIVDYMARKRRDGLAPKTVANHMRFLHGLFDFAVKRGWMATNLVAQLDRPSDPGADPDIRFLELHDVDAVIREVPDDDTFVSTDRTIYLTAAMTGLRQGELIALRWQDVDWQAGRLRVRRNYVRGEWGTPKSRRSSRSVPMVDRVAAELERHFQESAYQSDGSLVFPHPDTGNPLDASALRKRFAEAREAAGVRTVRFHDLRHTFGTRMAAAGVPMRTLQEWMGHRDIQTTMIYADYAPSAHEREMAERAFQGPNSGPNLSETGGTADALKPHEQAESDLG